ncbi:MAG TPA: SGNH/GDSL hydrolase family protein, partial [Armatimonadetes bacterium]|nr:SGNH/GDSL hydrolase family protein [Armatimonadota bacterium]
MTARNSGCARMQYQFRHAVICVFVVAFVAVCLKMTCSQQVAPPQHVGVGAIDVNAQAGNWLKRWRAKGNITIVAYGDSIAAGVGVTDPSEDSYPALIAHFLRQWLAPTRVQVIQMGIPGATTDTGLREIERVIATQPDLVLIQFGGNDSRNKRPIHAIQNELSAIIGTLRERLHAAIILIVPPFQTRTAGGPVATAIREIGRKLRVTIADFDRALHEHEHDFRGWFSPPPTHPGEYSHVIMAQELWRSLHRLFGRPLTSTVQIGDTSLFLPKQSHAAIKIDVRTHTQRAVNTDLTVEHAKAWYHWRFENVTMNEGRTCELKLLPPISHSMRSISERIVAMVRADDDLSWDVKWV